jgi:hypothetical protein
MEALDGVPSNLTTRPKTRTHGVCILFRDVISKNKPAEQVVGCWSTQNQERGTECGEWLG